MKLNKNIFLAILVAILTFTYFLSFTKHFTTHDTSKKIKTQLVNEKYKKAITKFEFTKGDEKLFLIKNDDFWILKEDEASKACLAVDLQKIEKFIEELTSYREIKQLSSALSQKNNYGFYDSNAVTLRYYTEDENFYELIFGGQDFSLQTRYFMVSSKTTVFEIDNTFDAYLELNIQTWSDSSIISKNILGDFDFDDVQSIKIVSKNQQSILSKSNTKDFYDKVSSFLSLRHGGLAQNAASNQYDLSLSFEFGNKRNVTLYFFESVEPGQYIIVSEYFIEIIGKKYYFTSKISGWTYNKIKEIML